ncbi:MAG: hypothetical protein LQ344_003641 [Seirophora lacunosa]|nr:MAG: hypothetical protein LQ344_003641 [Seirophora lacunosa]
MTSLEPSEGSTPSAPGLRPGSYTAHRLQHASPEHLHLTTRRYFIGPIPEGWLKSHRKSWFGEYVNLANYSSRAATFSTSPGHASQSKRVTGLDGASSAANFTQSFPQPNDVEDPEEDEDEAGNEDEAGDQEEGELIERNLSAVGEGTSEGEAVAETSSSPESRPKHNWLLRPREESKTRKPHGSHRSISSFVTAPSEPRSPEQLVRGKLRQPSFVTALEPLPSHPTKAQPSIQEPDLGQFSKQSTRPSYENDNSPVAADGADSRTSLLHQSSTNRYSEQPPQEHPATGLADSHGTNTNEDPPPANHVSSGMVRFNMPTEVSQRGGSRNATTYQVNRRRSWRYFRHGEAHPGEIVKTEKMLVRIDAAVQQLPTEYDENYSIKTESRTLEKWREYVVVCRESRKDEESDFAIQFYKSRVIPAMEDDGTTKRCTHEIPLLKKTTNVNLYSSLDKTLVIWIPWKGGAKMFILRPRSSSSSVEWYTFIRNALGWTRPQNLQVHVPDLGVTLNIADPFSHVEAARKAVSASAGDEAALIKTMKAEEAVASIIIQRCVAMIEGSTEWAEVVENWLEHEKMGLAWKRYDRLEWVHGANEQKMYGTMAMQKSHALELRPKKHYPTSVKSPSQSSMEEPAPIEGFLIRLTSQRGRVQRLGKMFFKRLYFFTHNRYLCYCRPAKAVPPPPPKESLGMTSKIPTAAEIVDKTPLIYTVDPYPIKDGKIEWLSQGTAASIARADEEAYTEAGRRTNSLLDAEGYINMCHIVKVRMVQRGSTPADATVDQGSDVDFHRAVSDSRRDDGKTDEFDDERTFELVMRNGLVVRLQAFNKNTKKEWMIRMRKLVAYWKLRTADDMTLLKSVRQTNLDKLDIDEEMEAHLGQFAEKWEVSRAIASPQLFNICGISCCRAITMSGTLYRKPRKHTTFLKCGVILCHGHLLIFHGTLRERTGKEVPHIQHERQAAIDLRDCYIYSGLVTEGDLLYQNRTFDSNHPGHNALPRVYLEDGWTSTDEDTMTCFVIWQATRKSFFKAREGDDGGKARQRLRYVSRLGVPGRGMVFKARSRAERDHWVMSVGTEIERLQQGEEVRVVDQK